MSLELRVLWEPLTASILLYSPEQHSHGRQSKETTTVCIAQVSSICKGWTFSYKAPERELGRPTAQLGTFGSSNFSWVIFGGCFQSLWFCRYSIWKAFRSRLWTGLRNTWRGHVACLSTVTLKEVVVLMQL
jgi:hypothetical protein